MKIENNRHHRRVLEFDRYRLYPDEHSLETGGRRVRLTPRVIELLILLIEHRGEAVEKEEILQTLWPNSFVEENNVNQAVSALRKALGRDSSGGQFVETVPKVGFRFVTSVIAADEEITLQQNSVRHSRRKDLGSGLTIGGILILAMAASWYLVKRPTVVGKDGLVNLTNNLAEDSFPSCSPDGKQIAFSSNRDGNANIYLMNIDGSNVRRLTNVNALEADPNWSPDGGKILFVSNRDGNPELYSMNADGSEQKRLTFNPTADGGPARFSPDGTKIAFARGMSTEGMDYYNFDIFTMNADGTGVRQLTTDREYDAGPVWSPDGTKIAFTSAREKNYDVFIMNADGTDQTNITNTKAPVHESPMAWTKDGKQLIIAGNTEARTEISQMWVINVDGSGRRQITTFPDDTYQIFYYSSALDKFTVVRRTEGNAEVYLLDANMPGS